MARSDLPPLTGLLAIDKPAGLTSHDVVARVRRLTGMQRVGHAGTLDPFATGVLVVAVGQATRLLQFIQERDKSYRAHIVLGVETDTLDVEGTVTARSTPARWPELPEVARAAAELTGHVRQVPPVYSAIKVDGRKLYERARQGEQVEAPAREVVIHAVDVRAYEPPEVVIDVSCGTGTYIRSLARDLGDRLGTGAYCHALCRTSSGSFDLAQCWTLDELAEIDVRERWPELAIHPDRALRGTPAVVLGGRDSDAWCHGLPVNLANSGTSTYDVVRAYAEDGAFLGVGRIDAGHALRPARVMSASRE
jgi:tRNA pseudouridine55 synthase